MWILTKFWPHILLVTALSVGYYTWTSMEREIKQQATTIMHKDAAIVSLSANIIEIEKSVVSEKKRAVAEALAEEGKRRIEKGLNRDTSLAVPIDDTRFYL